MKKEVKKIKWSVKNKIILGSVAFIIIILLGMGSYEFINRAKICDSKACFEDAIAKCKKVSWIREDDIAAWNYVILRSNDENSCRINVKLLKLNKGDIDLERLQGEYMICNFLKNDQQFPEKDIAKCSGILKEDLQDILIQRMHDYMLKNLGDIANSFVGI
jgi:hypothetical protein